MGNVKSTARPIQWQLFHQFFVDRYQGDPKGAKFYYLEGEPEDRVQASVGSMAFRTDGYENNTVYAKERGTGKTGWRVLADGGGSGEGGGDGVHIGYSADDVAWHEDLAAGDLYIRFVVAADRPAEDSNAWTPGRQFVGGAGAPGQPGPAGQGVPQGGHLADVLAKASSTDYDTTWLTLGPQLPLPSLPDVGKVAVVNAGGDGYELVTLTGGGTDTNDYVDDFVVGLVGQELTLTIERTGALPDLTQTVTLPAGGGGGLAPPGYGVPTYAEPHISNIQGTPTDGQAVIFEAATGHLIFGDVVGGGSGEENVKADWDEVDPSSDAFIQNKPTIPAAANDYVELAVLALAGQDLTLTLERTGALPDLVSTVTLPASGMGTAAAYNGARLGLTSNLTAQDFTSFAQLSWTHEVFDTDGWYDPGQPTRLTVPAGVTHAVFHAGFALHALSLGADVSFDISRNGHSTGVGYTGNSIAIGTIGRATITTGVIEVSEGDYFDVSLQVQGDTSVTLHQDGTFFSVHAASTGTGSGDVALAETQPDFFLAQLSLVTAVNLTATAQNLTNILASGIVANRGGFTVVSGTNSRDAVAVLIDGTYHIDADVHYIENSGTAARSVLYAHLQVRRAGVDIASLESTGSQYFRDTSVTGVGYATVAATWDLLAGDTIEVRLSEPYLVATTFDLAGRDSKISIVRLVGTPTATGGGGGGGGGGSGEDNVNANWDETDTASDAFILNKPSIPDPVGRTNVYEQVSDILQFSANIVLNKSIVNETITISAPGLLTQTVADAPLPPAHGRRPDGRRQDHARRSWRSPSHRDPGHLQRPSDQHLHGGWRHPASLADAQGGADLPLLRHPGALGQRRWKAGDAIRVRSRAARRSCLSGGGRLPQDAG